jgi:fatty acid desaturase
MRSDLPPDPGVAGRRHLAEEDPAASLAKAKRRVYLAAAGFLLAAAGADIAAAVLAARSGSLVWLIPSIVLVTASIAWTGFWAWHDTRHRKERRNL